MLSKAAAERMALDIDLEGLHYRNGQIVLSGRASAGTSIDAALFLTALRTACEVGDPFFSLDPDNGQAWSDQGRRASTAVWERIKGDYAWDQNLPANRGRNAKIPDGLTMRTLSVKRDFPHMWSNMVPSYPDLKTRLVFRPTWLRHTRFGEILYKADVLLKELSSGVSIVDPGMKLRAATVDGYVAPQMQSLVGTIFEQAGDTGYRGHRLWFDLMPQSGAHADPTPAALPALDPRVNRPLYSELAARGYISARVPTPVQKTALYASGDATDLSNVYPKMFVRRHDHATGKDISGTDAYLNAFSWDVNERTERYVAAYKELRNLTEVFRAYLASVSIIRHDAQVCRSLSVQVLPLYDSEKTSVPLPEFHPSELFIYVVMHVTRQGNQRSLSLRSGNSISGGIALRGQEFYNESVAVRETPVIVELKQELAKGISDSTWRGRSGKRFVALAINSDGATTAEATRPRGLLDRDDATTADAKPRGLLDPDGATTADAKPRGLLDPDDATATAKARPRGLLD